MSHLPNDPAHGNSGPGGPLPTGRWLPQLPGCGRPAGEHYARDDEPAGGPLPEGVQGFAISGREQRDRDENGER